MPKAKAVYDALGNRVATKVNDEWRFMVYDAFGKMVAEYGNEEPDITSGLKFVHQDWQGSVRTVTNRNGYVISRTDHQAFGDNIGAGIGNRNTAQGYLPDQSIRQGYGMTENDGATGQQHTWFRKLETQAGRWTSPDPYKGSMSLGDPQSFNRYAYVNNNPTNYIDPSGLMLIVCTTYEYFRWEHTPDGPVGHRWESTSCTTYFSGGSGPGYIPVHGPTEAPGGISGGGNGDGGVPSVSPPNNDCTNEFGFVDMRCVKRKAEEAAKEREKCLQNARAEAVKRENDIETKYPLDKKLWGNVVAVGAVTGGLTALGAAWTGAGALPAGVGGAAVGGGGVLTDRVYNRVYEAHSSYVQWMDDLADCGVGTRGLQRLPKNLRYPF